MEFHFIVETPRNMIENSIPQNLFRLHSMAGMLRLPQSQVLSCVFNNDRILIDDPAGPLEQLNSGMVRAGRQEAIERFV